MSADAFNGASFHELFVNNPLPMWLFDKESLAFVDVNGAAVQHYGYSREQFLLMTLNDIRPPEDVPRLLETIEHGRSAGSPPGFSRSQDWRHRLADGSTIWVDIYSHDFHFGDRLLRLAMVHDITELKLSTERLQQQAAFFSQLFHNSPEAIVMLDEKDCVVDANRAFERLFLYSAAEAKGRPINDLVVPPHYVDEASALSRDVLGGRSIERDTVRQRKDGSLVDVSVLGYPITISERQVGVFALFRDVTQAKRIAAQLAHHSTHDPLTGLINRHEFERRTREKLARAPRIGALLYFEIDQFKLINDGYGHEAGDRLLSELAELLRHQVREADLLGRLGGDEYGVLMEEATVEAAVHTAERILGSVADFRFRWRDSEHRVTFSAGIVPFDGRQEGLSEVMAAADAACQSAKSHGRNRVEVFSADDQDLLRLRGELSWGARILEALEADRFDLFYQRIVPLAGLNGVARSEILLRVIDPGSGARLTPGVFVSAAERYGLMPMVDRYVIGRVLRELERHRIATPERRDVVCVNVSGASLGEEGLARFIREQLVSSGVAPTRLCFEITETAAIRNISRALGFISEMRGMGCAVALDDFGSGMSSFGYLKSFNVDYLKIDGSFIRDMAHNPLDRATAEAINRVAQVKGLRTIAECVENEETLCSLRELGVDYAQGFHLHRPERWEV
ncbi:MAG TPA: EAL domain-containing protein [Solimonas sp.]|nr:EAL domain-containing protein [Solimonas sp.]